MMALLGGLEKTGKIGKKKTETPTPETAKPETKKPQTSNVDKRFDLDFSVPSSE